MTDELTNSISSNITLLNKPLWLQISLAKGLLSKDVLFSGTISSLQVPDMQVDGRLYYAADSDLTGPCDVAGNIKVLKPDGSTGRKHGVRIDFSRDGNIFAKFQFPDDNTLDKEGGSASGIFAGPAIWIRNPEK